MSSRPPLRSLLVALLVCTQASCYGLARRALHLPPFTHRYDHKERIGVAMRDGVKLVTDVYFPEGKGPWPVLLVRNPYNIGPAFGPISELFTRYGYVSIHQYCRGRLPSEGAWLPLLNERNDGIDTLQWITKQPWQDGNIGMFGASYLSFVQMAVADALPPQVKTLVPMEWGDDVRSLAYQDGMFRLEVPTMWAAIMHDRTMDIFRGGRYQRALRHRPHREVDRLYFGGTLPWYQEWISSPSLDAPIWQREDARLLPSMPERVTVPVLMLTGWYDLFPKSEIENFDRLKTRGQSRLIVGPWTHLGGFIGDGVKPFPGAGDVGGQMEKILNWLDHWLKGTPLEAWGPVETYAIGEGTWHTWESWPPPTRPFRFYFGNPADAKTCKGGSLVPHPDPAAVAVSYVYDPDHPVPTQGGGALLAFTAPGWGGSPPSVREQRPVCDRNDVLSFLSPPLETDLKIEGAVRFRLTVSSNADDTSFTAKLIEVDRRGRALNIQDSITSLAYRNGATMPIAYTPGTPVTVAIDLWPIEWTVHQGFRLRVDLSSSNFPAYFAHTNYAGLWSAQAGARKARETYHFGGADAAYLEIPVRAAP